MLKNIIIVSLVFFISNCGFKSQFAKQNLSPDMKNVCIILTPTENYERIVKSRLGDVISQKNSCNETHRFFVILGVSVNSMQQISSSIGAALLYNTNMTVNYNIYEKIDQSMSIEEIQKLAKTNTKNQNVESFEDPDDDNMDDVDNTILLRAKQKKIYNGSVYQNGQYIGSPMDLMAQYNAKLRSFDELAMNIIPELSSDIINRIDLYLQNNETFNSDFDIPPSVIKYRTKLKIIR
jgi:hypothetical protein